VGYAWALHSISPCLLGIAYVLEDYSSPMFSTPVSYCCVVLLILVNIYGPGYALEAPSSPVYVLEAYILPCSTIHTCSQSLQSV